MMDSDSGEVHVTPRLGTEQAEPYTVDLVAVDESGSKALVESFTVQVSKMPPPALSAAPSADSGVLVGAALGTVIALLVGALVAYQYNAHRLKMAVHDFQNTLASMLSGGQLDEEQAAERFIPREIKRSCVALVSELGKGAFGAVWKARLQEAGHPEQSVAVKTVLDAEKTPEGADELVQEAIVMAQVGAHPNVVGMVGVVTSGPPMLLVLEICERGSLLSVLRAAREKDEPLEVGEKLRLCVDAASGMAHLHAKRFMHRDLAARNLLVSRQGECKVADFGLSRGASNSDDGDVEDPEAEQYYRSSHGMFPIRWTAPESIETFKFTPASDVWSFVRALCVLGRVCLLAALHMCARGPHTCTRSGWVWLEAIPWCRQFCFIPPCGGASSSKALCTVHRSHGSTCRPRHALVHCCAGDRALRMLPRRCAAVQRHEECRGDARGAQGIPAACTTRCNRGSVRNHAAVLGRRCQTEVSKSGLGCHTFV